MIYATLLSLVSALIAINTHQLSLKKGHSQPEHCEQILALFKEHNLSWNEINLGGATTAERLSLAACLRSQDAQKISEPLHDLLGQFEEGEMTQLGPHQALLLCRQPEPMLVARIFGFRIDQPNPDVLGEEAIIGDLEKAQYACKGKEREDYCLERGFQGVAELFLREPMAVRNSRLYGNRLAQFLMDSLAWAPQQRLRQQVESRLAEVYAAGGNKTAIERTLNEYVAKVKLIMADIALHVYPILLKADYKV